MGRIVNQRELAEILGLTAKSLSLWQRDGLPVKLETENGLANQYDTAEVIAWYVAREVAKAKGESEKDRLSRLQGDKLELELAEMRSKLIPAELIEPAWTGQVVACRQTLLAISGRLSQLVAPMNDPDSIRILIDDEIEDALLKLSTNDEPRVDGDDAEGARPVGAAAEDQAVTMG